MNKVPALLAFESSCDETAVAVVDQYGRVWAQALASQIEIHRKYGGVVPEVASRSHFEVVDSLTAQVLAQPQLSRVDVVGVASTMGPGLVGPLLVGASYAEGFATGRELPFVGVHHLRGHLASVLLNTEALPDFQSAPFSQDASQAGSQAAPQVEPPSLRQRAGELFPALVLLVSGGHTQVLRVDAGLAATRLADTADDAAGECLDKSAKLMGLPYPGGPAIEKIAAQLLPADLPRAQELLRELPRPRSQEGFSFSGLKTAVRVRLQKEPALAATPVFCWALQECVAQSLVRGLERALAQLPPHPAPHPAPRPVASLVFCGGVSANLRIRENLARWCSGRGLALRLAPLQYCTDNAAMIGAAAWVQDPTLALTQVVSRAPLDQIPAEATGQN